jgi:2-keto-3-deoxy-L-rhamnonate aldolase RhmA
MNTEINTDKANFKARLVAGEALLGSFVKTPAPLVCEVLAQTGLDAICLDAEHAPFGRMEIDGCLHALRAAYMPSLVRIPTGSAEHILNALDCGATGVVVPHVVSARQAEELVKAAHYGAGGRGYAGSTRAAGFAGKAIRNQMHDSAATTTVILQIEDLQALENIEEIAAVDGVDCLFIGRIDLTVALGADSPQDSQVISAVERICDVARAANKRIGMFVPDAAEAQTWIERGASLFLLESDQVFLLRGAADLRKRFDARTQ